MATIDLQAINKKTERFMKSPAGKKKEKNCIQKYMRQGKPSTAAGSQVPTIKIMKQAANALVDTMLNTAKGYDVPDSVLEHIKGMANADPVYFTDVAHKSGAFRIDLNLSGDTHRDSLEPYKYDGVDNIVLIFNNGYSKDSIKYVWGFWHGEIVKALPDRPGLHFIESAIDDFNRTYGVKYNVTVQVNLDLK